MTSTTRISALCAAGLATAVLADPVLIGPTPYLSAADSPFSGFAGFTLEDFEDGSLNTLGISETSGNGSIVLPSNFTDSVDGDDGAMDGMGRAGHSMTDNFGDVLTFEFDAGAIGQAPTQAGLVWTDGGNRDITVTFEAFDTDGVSLGLISDSFFDDDFAGQTDEDRFYGVEYEGGIGSIEIRYSGGKFEIDHVQFGLSIAGVPLPSAAAMAGLGLCTIGVRRRR